MGGLWGSAPAESRSSNYARSLQTKRLCAPVVTSLQHGRLQASAAKGAAMLAPGSHLEESSLAERRVESWRAAATEPLLSMRTARRRREESRRDWDRARKEVGRI